MQVIVIAACIPVKMRVKASSTLVASSAEVSMNDNPSLSQKFCIHKVVCACGRRHDDTWASSRGTARMGRSLLLPTSMMTMLGSAWSRSSLSQRSTFSNVSVCC